MLPRPSNPPLILPKSAAVDSDMTAQIESMSLNGYNDAISVPMATAQPDSAQTIQSNVVVQNDHITDQTTTPSSRVSSVPPESPPLTDEPERMPSIDYVLVYRPDDPELAVLRAMFEQCMRDEGLQVYRERSGYVEFVKIHCPFERLCVEAERIRLEMPLKGCQIPPNQPTCFKSLIRRLTTDTEIDMVSAPFENDKQHLYDGADQPNTFFRTATRNFLVYNILINITINEHLNGHEELTDSHNDNLKKRGTGFLNKMRAHDALKRKGLWYLRMKNAYTDDFCLHDPSQKDPYYLTLAREQPDEFQKQRSKWHGDARADMHEKWTKFGKFQPLWMIRNYYGEKIALYFAWIGTFITVLWVPSLIGAFVFIYGMVAGFQDIANDVNCTALHPPSSSANWSSSSPPPSTSTYIPFSSPCHPSRTSIHASSAGTQEDLLGLIRTAFDNIFSAFYALGICAWGALFLEFWKRTRYTLAYEWDCDTFENAEPDRPQFFGTQQEEDPITGELAWVYPQWRKFRKFLVSAIVVSIAVIVVFVSVTSVILLKVTMRVQFNCTAKYNLEEAVEHAGHPLVCMMTSVVLPSFLNAASIMLLGKLYENVAHKLTEWENHRSQTQYNNSVIVKLFAFQFANTYASLFYIAFFRPEQHGFQDNGIFGLGEDYKDVCNRGTCLSLLSFQVLVLMLLKPLPKFYKDIIWPWIKRVYKLFKFKKSKQAIADNDLHKLTESRAASAGSTASANCAHVSSAIERNYLKPNAGDFTLGEYTEKVIQFGYIMMFAASFPLAPLLALLINLVDVRIDASRLLWWNRRPVAFLTTSIGMWLHILQFICYCGVVSNAFIVAYTSNFCDEYFEHQCTTEKRLLLVILFEHTAMLVMYLIKAAVPDEPTHIVLAQRRERYQVTKILEGGTVHYKKTRQKPDRRRQQPAYHVDSAHTTETTISPKSNDSGRGSLGYRYRGANVERTASDGVTRVPNTPDSHERNVQRAGEVLRVPFVDNHIMKQSTSTTQNGRRKRHRRIEPSEHRYNHYHSRPRHKSKTSTL